MNQDDIHTAAARILALCREGRWTQAFAALDIFEQDAAGRITDRIRRWGATDAARRLEAKRFG